MFTTDFKLSSVGLTIQLPFATKYGLNAKNNEFQDLEFGTTNNKNASPQKGIGGFSMGFWEK